MLISDSMGWASFKAFFPAFRVSTSGDLVLSPSTYLLANEIAACCCIVVFVTPLLNLLLQGKGSSRHCAGL